MYQLPHFRMLFSSACLGAALLDEHRTPLLTASEKEKLSWKSWKKWRKTWKTWRRRRRRAEEKRRRRRWWWREWKSSWPHGEMGTKPYALTRTPAHPHTLAHTHSAYADVDCDGDCDAGSNSSADIPIPIRTQRGSGSGSDSFAFAFLFTFPLLAFPLFFFRCSATALPLFILVAGPAWLLLPLLLLLGVIFLIFVCSFVFCRHKSKLFFSQLFSLIFVTRFFLSFLFFALKE